MSIETATRPPSHPDASGAVGVEDQSDPAPARMAWPEVGGLAFGGDYNPEQWDELVWPQDIELMAAAGVNLVSVGIFAWARIESRPGVFDFGWLDRILHLLHAGGISVDLGTPTAAPPAWFYLAQPESWVVDADGRRLGPGSRGICCPSSPAYAVAAARITTALAERYSDHPAVVMWHVHNEYGAPVSECHCDRSQIAFRDWLLQEHGSIQEINRAWGTTFWGQTYASLEEIRTPAAAASVINPAQRLDYRRFCDAALRACYLRERDILKARSPRLPVTTNFMASSCPSTNLWRWAPEVDVVSNDHYLTAERTDSHVLLSMDADLTRSLAAGRPWILMEHSTSAVNWQQRNLAKEPGEMTRNSLTHIARGADAALFFQWRASRSGAEKFHSSMLPHAGTGSPAWRELVELGTTVGALRPVRGSRVRAEVAILWDWESFWAQDLDWRPSVDLGHRERTVAFYTRLWRDKISVDFAHPSADLSRYKMVVVPQMYLLEERSVANLENYVLGGGQLVVSYFSGVVDRNDAVQTQGLSGPLGDVLGINVQEFAPLAQSQYVTMELAGRRLRADVWTDRLLITGPDTQAVAVFLDGPARGLPAITRRTVGSGSAWYVATRLDDESLAALLEPIYSIAGLISRSDLPAELEMVTRTGVGERFHFLINHSQQPAAVPLSGTDLVSGDEYAGDVSIPPGRVLIVRQAD